MTKAPKFQTMAILLAGSMLATGTAAQAQDTPADAAATADTADTTDSVASGGDAGEIIDTANKRGENLQKVPISVSAFTGVQIERLGITDTTQITQQIPSLRVNAWSPNLTKFSLRGISECNFSDNLEAPVSVYQDNAYLGSMNALAGQFLDVKRVEVLRGPQRTLFGRNATGGRIHYLSEDASRSEFNAYVQAD